MFRTLTGLSAAAVVLATSVSAYGLTVTNRDSSDYSLTISEEGAERVVVIKADETLNDICSAGCAIAVGESEAVEFSGHEVVTIEGGGLSVAE